MDILTHAGIGLIAAAPLLSSRPELALGLVAGSVLPDLDALSRVFGKRAFLRSHQTWSHALPLHAAVSVLAGLAARLYGADGLGLGAGLFAGLAGHGLLDLSNTLGVTLLAPFCRRRLCLEWMFFIDAFVLGLTMLAAGFSLWLLLRNGEAPLHYAGMYFGMLAVYVGAKGALRRRAAAMAPEAVTLVPSALCPWQFFGVGEGGDCVRLFQINVRTGRREGVWRQEILDATHADRLAQVPEFRLMRELSPAYHVVSATKSGEGEVVACRDLRTRNFGTSFGGLEVVFDGGNRVIRTTFHV